MAQINSGAGAAEALTIDPVSLAGRSSLYGLDGTLIVRPSHDQMTNPSGAVVSGINDGNALPLRTDRFGNIGTTNITPVVWEQWENTTLNTQRWTNTATTYVTATTTTGINLNSTALTTASSVNVLLSNKRIIRTARSPIQFRARVRVSNYANSQNDFGLSDGVTAAAQIANGVYFQVTTTGAVQGVVTTASTDVSVALTFSPVFSLNNFYTWDILVDDDNVLFTVQDTSTGKIVSKASYQMPSSGARMFAATHLATFNRSFITATPPATAPIHICSLIFLGYVDMAQGSKPWPDILAQNTMGSILVPTTFAQAQQYANSAEPASATLSNTAAGYTTLGGRFQFAAVAGAATDYVLFGFTVPSPFSLVVRGITIDTWNTVIAGAVTPTLMTWGLFANSTTVSAAGNGLRRFIGAQSFPVGTAAGANVAPINKHFDVPIVTDGGRFFGILLRMPVSTATATQVIAGVVDIDGYFE